MTGRYELFGPVAAGGMATVHFGRVRGGAGFRRIVAIKRLHRELAQVPELAASLADEARLVSRIHHPNVVPILDVAEEDGDLLLVMEYVAGESLAGVIEGARRAGERLPPAVAVAIVVEALRGLHAAHTATSELGDPLGIVHRDVSPQNVIVGADGLTRLVDFGVAKARSRVASTRAGQLKGKLGYMAPEQVMGAEVGPGTDVFAAAVVLWEALVGARLFAADNEGQVVMKLLEAKVGPPSAAGAASSPALDAVVVHGLARDPAARFRSAAEFAAALERAEPPASAALVASWVARCAGPRLAERAARVAEIERGAPAPDPRRSSRPAPVYARPDEATQDDVHAPRDAASVSPLTSPAPPAPATPAPRRRGSALFVAVALAVAAAVAAGAAAFLRPDAVSSSASAAPSAVASGSPVTAAVPPSSSSAAPTAEASAEPTSPTPASAQPRSLPVGRARSEPRRAPSARTPAAGCNPPFTVDAEGIQHLKPECAR